MSGNISTFCALELEYNVLIFSDGVVVFVVKLEAFISGNISIFCALTLEYNVLISPDEVVSFFVNWKVQTITQNP